MNKKIIKLQMKLKSGLCIVRGKGLRKGVRPTQFQAASMLIFTKIDLRKP